MFNSSPTHKSFNNFSYKYLIVFLLAVFMLHNVFTDVKKNVKKFVYLCLVKYHHLKYNTFFIQ